MKARTALVAAILVVVVASAVFAQRGRPGRGGRGLYSGRPARYATLDDFEGGFQFCRIVFRQGNGDGAGWNVDWPRADINLSIRLSELTRTPVVMDETNEPEDAAPESRVARDLPLPVHDDDRAGWRLPRRPRRRRTCAIISCKGGFLWADDYWGDYAWDFLREHAAQGASVGDLSDRRSPARPSDLPPGAERAGCAADSRHRLLGWREPDVGTPPARARPHSRHQRLARPRHGAADLNTDFGDSYERESENPLYFQKFSVPGYAFGINTIIYSLTH